MHTTPKISIITISFNAEKEIENTIKSVVNQEYSNIEYIIIDGKSSDGTTAIIKKYESKISRWSSEPDGGLYDAMNKGIKKATGDYIIFMNAGDIFYESETLSKIFDNKNELQDIYYGETIIVDENNNELGLRRLSAPAELNWKSFKRGMRVSHQAFIAKMDLVELYDLQYKFSADFDWCIKIMKKSSKIKNTNLIICRYLDGGLTKHNLVPSLKERFKIMRKFYGLFSTLINHITLGTNLIWFVIKNKWF